MLLFFFQRTSYLLLFLQQLPSENFLRFHLFMNEKEVLRSDCIKFEIRVAFHGNFRAQYHYYR